MSSTGASNSATTSNGNRDNREEAGSAAAAAATTAAKVSTTSAALLKTKQMSSSAKRYARGCVRHPTFDDAVADQARRRVRGGPRGARRRVQHSKGAGRDQSGPALQLQVRRYAASRSS